jgi:hypothetical protein
MANDAVIGYLDEFDTKLSADIALDARGDKKHKGFDNKAMIWYVEAWSKIAITIKGNGYYRDYRFFLDKRDLPKISEKSTWAKEAQRAVGTLSDSLGNNPSSVNQDVFQRADDAVMNFIYDYRQHTVGLKDDSVHGEKDFVKRVKQWTLLRPDAMRKEPVFNDELALTRGD